MPAKTNSSIVDKSKKISQSVMDQALAEIESAVMHIVTTDVGWMSMLDLAAKLPNYSPTNLMWLFSQAAQRGIKVSSFAGYKKWQELERPVIAGSKSFKVLAPIMAKREVIRNGVAVEELALVGFRAVSVFDISQTEGPDVGADVATPILLESGDVPDTAWANLTKLIEDTGFSLTRGDLLDANGITNFVKKEIVIKNGLSNKQALKTLFHEVGHMLTHGQGTENVPRNTAEIEAESIAYILCSKLLDIDSSAYSFPYITSWAGGDVKKIQSSYSRIKATVDKINGYLLALETVPN